MSYPISDIWFPVPPGTTTLPTPPKPTVNASPVPVNSAPLPSDWDFANPDIDYLFDTILATPSPAVFPLVVTPASIVLPYAETVTLVAITRSTLSVTTTPYAPILPPTTATLVTRTTILSTTTATLVTRTTIYDFMLEKVAIIARTAIEIS
jgi:hypothetical protein